MAATYGGHLEVAKLLLDRGADVNGKSKEGGTPLGTQPDKVIRKS